MRKLFFYVVVLSFFFSCTGKQEVNVLEDSPITVSLHAEDSVKISGILTPMFLLQAADSESLIFKDAMNSAVYVVDKKTGNISFEWKKSGDVPGAFGMASKNIVLSPKKDLVILDPNSGLRVFKKDGDLVKTAAPIAYPISFGGIFSSFQESQVVDIKGESYLLYSLDILDGEAKEYNSDFLKSRKNLVLTSLETGEHKLILPFPDNSKFVQGKIFPFEDFRIRFHVDVEANKLFVVFQNEQILYGFDWNEGQPELVSSQPFALPGFKENEGWEVGSLQRGQITDQVNQPMPARIQGMAPVENGFLISYSNQPDSKNLYALYKNKEASKEQVSQLFKEIGRKTVFMDLEGNVHEFEVPIMHYDSFFTIGNEVYWMKKPDPDVEAEDFTVYWGELTVE